jgi:hypothetical protein
VLPERPRGLYVRKFSSGSSEIASLSPSGAKSDCRFRPFKRPRQHDVVPDRLQSRWRFSQNLMRCSSRNRNRPLSRRAGPNRGRRKDRPIVRVQSN